MRIIEAYSEKISKKEIIGAFGFLVMVFFAFFVFEIVLYFFFPDLHPLLAFGLHLCFVIIVCLLVIIWGSWGRLREIFQEWLSLSKKA